MLNCVGIRDTWLAKSCHWEVVHLPHSDQRSQRHPEIQQIYIYIRIHYILCTYSSINRISGSYLIYARGVRKGAIIGLPWPFWMSWNVFHFSHHPLKITGALKLVSKDDLFKWLDTLLSAVPTALLQPGIHSVLTSPLPTSSPLSTSSLQIERWTSAKQKCSAVNWNLATMVTCWSRWTRC